MSVPVLLFWQRLIDAVVEVLVVREDNVAADIVELSPSVRDSERYRGETYEALWGHICGGKTAGSLVAVDDQPRWAVLQ